MNRIPDKLILQTPAYMAENGMHSLFVQSRKGGKVVEFIGEDPDNRKMNIKLSLQLAKELAAHLPELIEFAESESK